MEAELIPVSALQGAVWHAIQATASRDGTFSLPDVEAHLENHLATRIKARAFVWAQQRAGRLERLPGATPRFAVVDCEPPAEAALVASHKLSIDIPRTYDGLWALMRWLDDERGGFALIDLQAIVGHQVDPRVVREYVTALERGGFLRVEIKIGTARIYRVDRRAIEAPRVRADGTLLTGPRRTANMWRSMKMLTFFTAAELASAASMPELAVSVEQAMRYADALGDAGYLNVREQVDAPTVYRLKNAMNTGPAAPEVLRAHLVWDPNTYRVATKAARADEVRV